jgi:hypothetical protein
MDLKKLIEEHERIKTNEELTSKLIKDEISKNLRDIIPTSNFAYIDGISYTTIKKEINKKLKFEVPDNYLFSTLSSMENLSKSDEGKYSIKNY